MPVVMPTPEASQIRSEFADVLPLMLYDGECGLCDKSLRFTLDHEADDRLHFSPLQSDLGRRVLEAAGLDGDYRESILYVAEDGEVATHSTAAARIATHLRPPWRHTKAMRLIPRPLRDLGYRGVAAVRFKIFGYADASQTCTLLPPEQRRRIHL
jgi:predicted DCC family thiol-disulfide oxidoreductase YuxK